MIDVFYISYTIIDNTFHNVDDATNVVLVVVMTELFRQAGPEWIKLSMMLTMLQMWFVL